MKNKKIMIGLISVGTILLILALFSVRGLFMTFANKLMGNVSYPTSNGVQISCDSNNIAVGATTTCTLTGYYTGGVRGATGKITNSNAVSISEFKPAQGMVFNGGDNNGFVASTASGETTSSNQFQIATFKVTGVSEAVATLTATGTKLDEYSQKFELTDPDFVPAYVNDSSFNITVSNGSGGGDTPVVPKSSDNTLKSLKVNGDDISLTELTKTVVNATNQVSISAVANDSKATISGDVGTKSLSVGNNNFSIVVTAENGSTRSYNLTIIRQQEAQKSSINTLKTLTVTNATLNPTFNSSITSYTSTVENNVTKVTVNATKSDDKSQITEGLGEHNLNVGINTINIKVKAENNDVKTYVLKITRKDVEVIDDDTTKSSDNKLKSLEVEDGTLIPEFNSSKDQNYVAIVSDNTNKVVINAVTNNSKANISYSEQLVDGGIAFESNSSTKDINIIVTAENGSKKYISLSLMRQSYYDNNKKEVDNNTGNVTDTCVLQLKSSVYTIDNNKLEVNNVNKNHSIDTIKSNLTSDCGTIMVSENKVVLSSETQVKEYTINRVWIPQTGQKVIKYVAIIAVLLAGIAGLLFYKKKMDK